MKSWLYFIFCLFFSVTAAAQQSVKPLPIDKAFQFSAARIQNDILPLHWDIAKGYHLYKDRFKFSLADNKDIQLGQIILPPGISTHDNILGDYQIYRNKIDINIPMKNTGTKNAILLVTYQGCSEQNFCYPPVTRRINFNLQDLNAPDITTHKNSEAATYTTVQDKITHLLEGGNYLWICLGFMGLGLLLAFTPCVLPMIPILSGIIVGQNRKSLTTRRAFLLSLSYVLGMSFTYAIAGILVALLGSHLSETFQTPWVIVLFSLLFVLLAFSLFGFYELKLPNFILHRILHLSNKQKSGSYIGAVIMGALSVLIVSPCVTAPLVGILTFIAQKGNVVLGSTALFALGLGMGLPLLIIGTTEGRFLPKSGYWMNTVKSAFGVLLLGVAIYLLQRILPGAVVLMLWAALLITIAVYLGVDTHQRNVSSGWIKFTKGLGLLSFCYGLILLIGGAMGHTDPLYPLRTAYINNRAGASPSNINQLDFQHVRTLADVQAALNIAHEQHKPAMLDFYANWCVSCHEMDSTTFSDPMVKSALNDVILIRVDVTANDAASQAVQTYYHVIAPPTILFFGRDGREGSKFRIVGAMSPKDFLEHLQHVIF